MLMGRGVAANLEGRKKLKGIIDSPIKNSFRVAETTGTMYEQILAESKLSCQPRHPIWELHELRHHAIQPVLEDRALG